MSLWNGLGAKDGGLGQLNADDLAAVLLACEGELQRRCTESPNNLSRCRNELSKTLTQSAVGMQTAPADEAAERAATRVVLDALVPGYGWGNLGKPNRTTHSTATLSMFPLYLAQYTTAAEVRLALQPQRSAATSLQKVLAKLEIQAGEDTKSNDFIRGYALGDNCQSCVVLVDRIDTHFIVLHYRATGQQQNYLQRPASSLQLASNSEADLVELLCLIYEHQDRNQIERRPEVQAGIMFRRSRSAQQRVQAASRVLSGVRARRSRSDRLLSGSMEACKRR